MPHNERKYLIMKTFIVGTENFVAKNIACKALAAFKAVNDNEITRGLHAKACMKGRKVTIKNEDGTETVKLHRRIVITSIEEMQAWNDAIHAYEADKTIKGEAMVLGKLKSAATRGLEKRLNATTAPATAA
jgi:hypothetical protein